MRAPVDRQRLDRFMRELGARLSQPTKIYLVGGAVALLHDWRASTIDIDLALAPESDEVYRAIVALKNELDVNVELAAPSDFIPPLPAWESRSRSVVQHGPATFLIYDLYSQALAKIERGHAQDRADVDAMISSNLVAPDQLRSLYDAIEPELFRYPAIEPSAFRAALEETLARHGK